MIEDASGLVAAIKAHPDPRARHLFTPGAQLVVARAPGRLDVMGGIADYSGSLVLQWPIREATWAALERTDAPELTVVSAAAIAGDAAGGGEQGRTVAFSLPASRLADWASAGDGYAAARGALAREPEARWAAYVVGPLLALMREGGLRWPDGAGARLLIASDVPEGKGVSSSAAIEVATLLAAAEAFGAPPVAARAAALLCQRAENLVVGAPCGVMDQMASACGAMGALMRLRCQPADLMEPLALPEDLGVWGIDSGVRHAVTGADYATVRAAAFMGLRIVESLAEERGAPAATGGYLARLAPSVYDERYAAELPAALSGSEFLARYGASSDAAFPVDSARSYPVRAATRHPVYENFRVELFAELIAGGAPTPESRRRALGELMYQSHASYTACGLGSPATDRLVALCRAAGPAAGVYGAKITGGGSGGTVAVLAASGAAGAAGAVRQIAAEYGGAAGPARLFTGSSPGAAAYGVRRLAFAL